MEPQLKEMIVKLDHDLGALRPYTRREFKDLIDPVLGELDEPLRTLAYDHDRAPYIERRGIHDARGIIMSVPAESYPDPALFGLVCLQRGEMALYEKVRTAPVEGDRDEQRTLMYRAGMAKAIKVLAARLPEKVYAVWHFRRKALNILEDELWRMSAVGGGRPAPDRERVVPLADVLHSIPPVTLPEFDSPDSLAEWFESERGDDARRLADQVRRGSKQ